MGERLQEARDAFSRYLTVLAWARKGYHNSERWRDEGPGGGDSPTYQDMLDEAERAVFHALKDTPNDQ